MKIVRSVTAVVALPILLLSAGCAPQNSGRSSQTGLRGAVANMAPDTFQDFMSRMIDTSISDEIQINNNRKIGAFNLAYVSDETLVSSLPWLEKNAAQFPPEYQYLIARRLLKTRPESSAFWWLTGRLRLMYDVTRCTDKSTTAFVSRHDFEFHRAVGRLNLTPIKASAEDFQSALDWDVRSPPHKFPLLPTCIAGLEGIGLGLEYSNLAQAKPFSDEAKGTTMHGHAGRVVTAPAPEAKDPARWVRPAGEYPALLEKVRDA